MLERCKMKQKILNILLIGIISLGLIGCTNGNNNNNNGNAGNNNSTTTSDNNANSTKKYGLGETFKFDGLEITLDTTYTFVKVENKYSEYSEKPVIKLGANIKNISSKENKLNMLFYTLYGPQGTKTKSVAGYFDVNVDYSENIAPGATNKTYFYILYDGDGKYSINFNNFEQELTVEFNVTK